MKKVSLLTTALFIVFMAGAQVKFGVKAGINLSSLHVSPSNPDYTLSTKTGFNAGAFATIHLLGSFSLQPEIVYSGQGAKVKGGTSDSSFNINYVNVPLLLKYQSLLGIFIEAGPQAGFLTSAKSKTGSNSTDIKSQIKPNDISGVVGIGYMSPVHLGVDARYNFGFVNTLKDASASSVKNGFFQMSILYQF